MSDWLLVTVHNWQTVVSQGITLELDCRSLNKESSIKKIGILVATPQTIGFFSVDWFVVEFWNLESRKRILSYLIGTGFPSSRPPVWPQSLWVWWTCLPCSGDTLAWHGRNWLKGRQTRSNTCPRIRPWSLHEPELDSTLVKNWFFLQFCFACNSPFGQRVLQALGQWNAQKSRCARNFVLKKIRNALHRICKLLHEFSHKLN